MPFIFLILAAGLIVVAVKGTQSQAFTLLKSEFTGSNSFVVWVAAIAILGALAYIKPIRPVAVGFMVLVLLVMVLNNKGGFFGQFNRQLDNPIAPQNTNAGAASLLPTVPETNVFGTPAVSTNIYGQPSSSAPAGSSIGQQMFPDVYKWFGLGAN